MNELIAQDEHLAFKFCQNELFKSTVDRLLKATNYCSQRYRRFVERKRGVYPRYDHEHEIFQTLKGDTQY